MIYRELGKTGEKISAIGFGTWQLNKPYSSSIRAIRTAIEDGVNFIDTAEIYGTEPIVGKAVSGIKNLIIATKVWPNHYHYDDIIKSCNASLKRLGIKRIDLYQLHWPNKFIPIKETMRAMEKLVDSGKIRYVGVCNFDKAQLLEAQNAMARYGLVSDQVEYSLFVRDPEKGLLSYCRRNSMNLIAYSPLGHGKLFSRRYKKLFGMLEKLGKKYDKTPSEVALNWLIAHKNVIAIPKASNPDHARENSRCFNLSLSDRILIDAASRKFKTKSLKSLVSLPLSLLFFFKGF